MTPGEFSLPEIRRVTPEGFGDVIHADDATADDVYAQTLEMLRFRRIVIEAIDNEMIRLDRHLKSLRLSA